MHKIIPKYFLLIVLIILLNGNFTEILGIQLFNRGNYLKEKLYVTTDRNLYFTGENIWFKIICTEINYNIPVDISKIVYFELLSSDNQPVSRHKIELKEGFGSGCIALPDMLVSGNYKIRAYTNWMKNFGHNCFFIKNIIIINPDKETVFRKPETNIPVTLTANFSPESGRIIKDLNNHIIIRVLNPCNEGINARALLYKNSVALQEFEIIKGIGSFNLKPVSPDNYYDVKVMVNDSVSKTFALPELYEFGTILNLSDFNDKNISLNVSSNLFNVSSAGLAFLLKLKKNGIIYYSDSVFLYDTSQTVSIPASSLPEGISYIGLYNENKELLCTRPIYNPPKETLDIEIITEKYEFNIREKVNIVIKTSIDNIPVSANLAIKVKKTDDPFEGKGINFQNKFILNNILFEEIFNYYSDPYNKFNYSDINDALIACINDYDNVNKDSDIKYLPEIKGQIVSGKVINKESRRPVCNHLVYLSFIGPYAQMLSCRTNTKGEFSFSLNNRYNNNDIVLQLNDEQRKYIILLDDQYSNDFNDQKTNNVLDDEFKEYIAQKMINCQISKAYDLNEIHYNDAIQEKMNDFYGEPDESLILSDFVRLPVMEEVLVELLKSIFISTRKGAKNIFIIDKNSNEIIGDLPLYLIDGVPVFDPGIILSMDPAEVKSIKVVSSKYFLGDLVFDGILDIHTNKNKFDNVRKLKTGIRYEFESVIKPAAFISPQYNSANLLKNRIPDYRNTIYWNPSIVTDREGISSQSFYTSDETARFDIIVEGISYNGQAGYKKCQIEVTQ
jgi:hypothetical protein